MKNVEICYPGYSKKAITFTIDDGNLTYDAMMIDILRPHGIKGTFNLCAPDLERMSAEGYRELYRGFEIANHCKCHPYSFDDGEKFEVSPEPFSMDTADPERVYKHHEHEGVYLYHLPRGWRSITTPEHYTELVDECKALLEDVFGKGSITAFVWPFGQQRSAFIKEHLVRAGYSSVRRTGCTEDKTAFDLPPDRMAWSYNANHLNLIEVAEKYDAYPDDGRLKFFAFGVHSSDYERGERWGELRTFAEKYGDRPSDFWYATVGEIFAYADAAAALVITEGEAYNPTDLTVYVRLDGIPTELPAHSRTRI